MNIELHVMPEEQKPLLRNLMEKYLHDFSQYDSEDVDEHGLYGYKYVDDYWVEEERHPLLIRVESRIAGFVLVRRLSEAHIRPPFHSITEYFVMRKYRHQGVGSEIAVRVFDMFPGRWKVSQDPNHTGSHEFWQRVIGDYTGGNFEQTVDEEGDPTQIFDTRGRTGSP